MIDFWNELIRIVVSNGIFAVLFVWLFFTQMRDSRKREEKYQQTIESLSKGLNVLDKLEEDVEDIKDFLKEKSNEKLVSKNEKV